jgi:hypothetical protein
MSRKVLLAVALTACAATPVAAEPPYYFHKAAVSREAYMADVDRCASLATGVKTPNYIATPNFNAPYGLESVLIANFFIGFQQRAQQRRVLSRIERTCMADKGYQRREIEKPIYEEIRKQDKKAGLERLFALVSAREPTGEVLVE